MQVGQVMTLVFMKYRERPPSGGSTASFKTCHSSYSHDDDLYDQDDVGGKKRDQFWSAVNLLTITLNVQIIIEITQLLIIVNQSLFSPESWNNWVCIRSRQHCSLKIQKLLQYSSK